MVLVDGKPQVQQLQLAVVSIEQVSPRSTVLAGPSHVLTQTVQGGAFFGIAFWVITVGCADVGLEGVDPVDFVGLLERDGYHGGEGGHDGKAKVGAGRGEEACRLDECVGAEEGDERERSGGCGGGGVERRYWIGFWIAGEQLGA